MEAKLQREERKAASALNITINTIGATSRTDRCSVGRIAAVGRIMRTAHSISPTLAIPIIGQGAISSRPLITPITNVRPPSANNTRR
jgi:hypothetical protein